MTTRYHIIKVVDPTRIRFLKKLGSRSGSVFIQTASSKTPKKYIFFQYKLITAFQKQIQTLKIEKENLGGYIILWDLDWAFFESRIRIRSLPDPDPRHYTTQSARIRPAFARLASDPPGLCPAAWLGHECHLCMFNLHLFSIGNF